MGKFQKGHTINFKWTKELAEELMLDVYELVKNQEIYSISEALIELNEYPTCIYYILEKYPMFENYKKSIDQILISRINRGALKSDLNATASIWRMKQLGEKDTQYQEVKQDAKVEVFNPMDIIHGIKGDDSKGKS